MKVLKSLLNFYINSSIHVALAVCALTWITLLEFGESYDYTYLYFVFFASISAYNFVKYFGLAKFHHRSLANWLRVIQIFSAIAFVLMTYYFFQLQLKTYAIIGVLAMVTFLYAIPLIPKHYLFDEHKNLREISGAKIYIIAMVWSAVTVVLPVINYNIEITADVAITFFQRFCYVLVLMLPFEIRDLNYDSLKLATIPQRIGVKKTIIIGVLLLMVFMSLEFFKNEIDGFSVLSVLIITFLTLLFLLFSRKNNSNFYTSLWVEALPIFWFILLLLLT